jgi:hypothetical protein
MRRGRAAVERIIGKKVKGRVLDVMEDGNKTRGINGGEQGGRTMSRKKGIPN